MRANTQKMRHIIWLNPPFLYFCIMEQNGNVVVVQNATMKDIERMIAKAIDERMRAFYESVKEKPRVLVKRKNAAQLLGVSLPTLDAYGKHGILHPVHIGGRVFYDEKELLSKKGR